MNRVGLKAAFRNWHSSTTKGNKRQTEADNKGECSVNPSVAWDSLRSSTLHLCQVLNCRPGFGFSPPPIVPNISLLGNHPLLCHVTAPAKTSRRLRMFVSMPSERVIGLRAQKVAWSVQSKDACYVIHLWSRSHIDNTFHWFILVCKKKDVCVLSK